MMNRRVLAASAAFITVGIFAFLLASYPTWRAAVREALPWAGGPSEKTVVDNLTSQPQSTPSDPAVNTPSSAVAAIPLVHASIPADGAAPPPLQGLQAPEPAGPSFDVVRVEPSGESVIAARAQPGADIVLLDGGKPIAHAKADSNGQVVFVPPILAPGEHSLMLSVGEPNSPGALSSQSVAVSVPVRPTAPPMVALIQPDQPTQVLSGPVAGMGPSASEPGAPASLSPSAPSSLAISAIEVEDVGSFYATGKAAPGSHCRVYLNGSFVATVTAGQDGAWSLKIRRGMKPGHYVVRADQVQASDGQVQARAEVPFDYPAGATKAMSLLRPKPGQTPQAAIQVAQNTVPSAGKPEAGSARVASNDPSGVAATVKAGSLATLASGATIVPTASRAATNLMANADGLGGMGASPTEVAQLLTTKVVHGDTLWRISRKILGHGERYTQIYAANTTQIRNPRLIYPGQIFVMPQTATP